MSAATAPATRRKLTYFVLGLAILSVNTFLWRGVASPLTGNVPPSWSVAARANTLELTDLAAGQADLTGSTARLMLTGSRGLALAILWYQSDEKKKKHEWNKLELLVETITKLQPHSPAPWTYQSWNIAYNVSVESDRVRDKFFYIAKGIDLLARGVRLNKDQPDMRYMLGFYYQNKFGVADETNYFRSLFQMACIDPRDRDPAKLRSGDTVDPVEFEKFVRANPQLVRRLKDKLSVSTPDAVVNFLRDNRNIPSRYYDPEADGGKTGPKPVGESQFPTLPLEAKPPFNTVHTEDSPLADDFDNYLAARAWFGYAQAPLPPPEPQIEIRERVAIARDTGKRVPRAPALIIFRHLPIRAQAFVGERLEKEGWFDDSPWKIDEDRSGPERWFPEKSVEVGGGTNFNDAAWAKAFTEFEQHGQQNGMFYDAAALNRLEERSKLYRDKYKLVFDDYGPDLSDPSIDADLKASYRAHRLLFFYRVNRDMSNFPHHYHTTDAERHPETIRARKFFFDAARLNKLAEPERAMDQYERGFALWQKVLARFPEYRADAGLQDDIYVLQIAYTDLVEANRGSAVRAVTSAAGVLSGALNGPLGVASGTVFSLPLGGKPLPIPVVGPLDQIAPDGKPWLDPLIGVTARNRAGRDEPETPPATGSPREKESK
ncbi:MAG: hypothetical protein K1X57_09805 [Gemmataceae bacterium]|nr:hypothetical protein [Gemmataceae bacterium]